MSFYMVLLEKYWYFSKISTLIPASKQIRLLRYPRRLAGLISPTPHAIKMTDQKQKRNVVSSLIFTFPDDDSSKPKVALFRRSDKVRTYPHHLAPISGNIDPTDKDPLTAAWRELHEETTLTPANLTLWRIGKPFTFGDPTLNREWTVHPFAFKLKPASHGGQGEAAIRTDWEHESWEWHAPASIIDDEAFGGVPRLHETLRRVFPECEMDERAGEALARGLKTLREDHKSGAHELTSIALVTFRDIIAQTHEIDEKWWRTVRLAAWHLIKNGRESMGAATLNALLSILVALDEILDHPAPPGTEQEQKRERILSTIDSHIANRKANTTRLKDAFTSYIRSAFLTVAPDRDRITMLTLSASSTTRNIILDAFASLDIPTLELRILESRPLFEGATLASSIYSRFESEFRSRPDKRLDIKIYTDAAAALAAQDIDIVLLGADRICSSKGVSNKTGSLPVVLSAKHVTPSAKILVLSQLEKVVGDDGILEDKVEDNDPEEVFSVWRNEGVEGTQVLEDSSARCGADRDNSATVQVKNIYFEWVPLTLVDAFVSDEGVLDETTIKNKSQQLEKLACKYFDDL
ncbi:translation initiation factor eIF-2B subunit family protein [Aspergillus novofumigatus IBT 16806]|uniref:Translation initiation factor eIF-2B subunit family protein n=1 Tax=Aspergillus novofumigatus (strain IBT 16806) TaxID=1392255 RepID=A0A2I1CNP5_ASPN1|nr:translation initiation factor eIF-2B subunit family protein [Aspergillus novofumigatus IBT 16806]PKX99241.1 translation initiation factor eIF-2B subunit family protein [Aspergillus novofumigatus IBT 16806]